MAAKYPADLDDSTSGVGSLPPEENVHRDFEEALTKPTEAEADRGGTHAVHQASYDLEFWRLQGKDVSKLTFKGINSPKVTVSESKFQASTPAPSTERTWPLYSDGKKVPRDRVEHMRNSGEGKSDEVRQIYSALADQLQGFKEGENCYILPIQNGILFSKKEIATSIDNEPDSVCVEHEPRRGTKCKVFLAATCTVSQDSSITYKPGQRKDGGNFLIFEEKGSGCEGNVHEAVDVLTTDKLAVKKMQISNAMLHGKNPFSAFLKLAGCEQTCRAYGVILDEDNDCVYFLMELLDGKTLDDLLGDKNVPIGIPLAVDYTIDILKGLQYIHSTGMIHDDIIGINIMIVGPGAIIIDTTGARKASGPRSYIRDVENAINLLNDMLCKNTNCSGTWKASDKARRMFHKKTLEKLEKLLEEQYESLNAKSKSPTMDKIETLLQDLGIISEELKGLRLPSDSPDSSVDEPYQSDANQKAELQAYKAEIERERELRKKAEQDKMKAEQEIKALNERINRMDALLAKLEMEPKDNGQEGP